MQGPALPPPRHAAADARPGSRTAEGGLAAYGLGIERYALPGGVDLVGHLGGTAGYRSFVGSVRPLRVTVAFALNAEDDPTPLVIPVVQALASINVRSAEG